VCNLEGKKKYASKVKWKYGVDTKGEYTFVNQLGKSVVDHTLMSEGILSDVVGFRVETEIFSSHMPSMVTRISKRRSN
jgi:hypothetical protein